MHSRYHLLFIAALAVIAALLALNAELNAHFFSIVVDNKALQHTPIWLTCLLTIVLSLIPVLWFPRFSPVQSLLSVCLYFVLVMFGVFAAAHFYQVWVPPVGVLLAIIIAYPLWGCMRVTAAQAALDMALQNLQDELARLGMELETESPDIEEAPQEARVRKLALAAKHLRDMHKSRSDTLVFISHDIRSPLGTAMLLLDKFEDNKYTARMRYLLDRAYTMAEGFLQASRAEMTDVNKFQALDMTGLIQQVADEAYELLTHKSIKLVMQLPDHPVWVRGDFGLLFRAVSNVLLNAVNYAPAGSAIALIMTVDASLLRLEIIDEGPGIPEDKMQKLFKRFSRTEGNSQDQNGSGLGLYFVGITVGKHRGAVEAANTSQGAKFTITLPVERRKSNILVTEDRRVRREPAFDDTI